MKKSSFRHYSLNQSTRKQLSVQTFGGVDYSTQKFLVANGHAIDIKNYIYKNGIVQKRNGVEHIMSVKTINYIPADFSTPTQALVQEVHTNANNKSVNGIWRFVGEDNQYHVIAHIGKLLYEIKNLDSDQIEAELITTGIASVGLLTYNLTYEFEDYKSSAFVGGKKLWFLGGNKYMCLRYVTDGVNVQRKLFAVEDSDNVPVPTTTISITYKNSTVNQRNGLDGVNLMTEWRKNCLITGTIKSEDEKTATTFYEYTLDAPLICKNQKDTAGIAVTLIESGEIE